MIKNVLAKPLRRYPCCNNYRNLISNNIIRVQKFEFSSSCLLRGEIPADQDVFELMNKKGVHGRRNFGTLFESKEETSKQISETKVDRKISLTEDEARKIAEKMLTIDHSIDHFRKQIEECAGQTDRTERVNSILWEMQKQNKTPDFAMKLLIQDVSEGKKPRKRYDDSQFNFNKTSEADESTDNTESSATLTVDQENSSYTLNYQATERIVIEKFVGVKPGEDHGHKSNTAPPVQKEKDFKDTNFFEPIKAALSKTRRETEESISTIFKGKFSKK
ncbi:predicted protein [Naegleria gruberi]|uniref:Predicted protein n=1 Tax=Naegleria gruberi TaxID=5762 RepID=D2V543_NAEGR|nr:uncharacterized protein NAEGRDRAFT_64008 [Naegleria gruberi]EFC48210.1 predicted protein [Naegleria gruberi]|eukprot:XP_002680954.1 predicted protein [Naegleria gruberi strain NEG-M]